MKRWLIRKYLLPYLMWHEKYHADKCFDAENIVKTNPKHSREWTFAQNDMIWHVERADAFNTVISSICKSENIKLESYC